jgi:hypothetical protein
MNAREAKVPERRAWVAGLALMSFVLSLAAAFPRMQSVAPGGNPASLGNYGLTVVALVIGIGCAIGALIFNRALTPAWFRWLSVGMAGLGVLLAAYLLLALIGTCGVGVLGGVCQP